MEWYEQRLKQMRDLDEGYKIYQEQDLFESMKRMGIIREGGNKHECANKLVSMGSDGTSIRDDNDQGSGISRG